jgi:hypothetical protein
MRVAFSGFNGGALQPAVGPLIIDVPLSVIDGFNDGGAIPLAAVGIVSWDT